jgi:capsular exopolysaccharide synthesis family protein
MINFSELLWKPGQTRHQSRRTAPLPLQEEVEHTPRLNTVPTEKAKLDPDSKAALLTDSHSAVGDRFRFLRMRLHELRELAKLHSLVITSPLPGEGKSTIAMGLATALTEGGKYTTLLIEADMHHPVLANKLGIPSRPGLAECLENGLDPMSEIRKVEPLGWCLLQAGRPLGNPTQDLQSDVLSTVIQRVSLYFDWIVIDAPPVLPLTDALSLSQLVDATLIVARAGRTSRAAIDAAVKLIVRKHVLGIVLNGAEGLTRLYSGYQGHYGRREPPHPRALAPSADTNS